MAIADGSRQRQRQRRRRGPAWPGPRAGVLLAGVACAACGGTVDPGDLRDVVVNEVMLRDTDTLPSPDGTFGPWLELYNRGPQPIDLGELGIGFGDPAAATRRLAAPAELAPGGYLAIRADQTVGPAGETAWPAADAITAVTLHRGADLLSTLPMVADARREDVSVGLRLDSFAPPVLVLDEATPGRPNSDGDVTFWPRPPTFSVPRGHVDQPFELRLRARGGGEIYLTTDGTPPRPIAAQRYTAPLAITGSRTVRAWATYPDLGYTTAEVTNTYLFLDEAIAAPTMRRRITQDPVYGPKLRPALQAYPSIFITSPAALNPSTKVAVAVELYDPSGAEPGFSITAGAKLVGSHSLGAYPKNNIRLHFEAEFGPSKLRYPLYAACCTTAGHQPADAFDELTLRSGGHDSVFYLGARGQPVGNGQYVRNRFLQETQRRMGQMSTDGRFVQVFLNRAYLGQFDLQERPNASFMAAHLGGSKDDYADVNGAVLGDLDVWGEVKAATASWEQASRWIDIDNLIDYQLLQYVAGNDWDWLTNQNWLAAGPRAAPGPGGAGWRFFGWDSDITFLNPLVDVTDPRAVARTGLPINPPDGVFTALRAYPEFRARVAARAALHFGPGGALTDEAMGAAYAEVAHRVELSLVAESARWGDYAGLDWTVDGAWRPERDRIVNQFFAGRAARVLAQLRAQGILPP